MQDIRKLFVLTVLLLAVSVLAFGQSTAAITGQITDPQNAAIANASVSARDLDRGTVVSTQSNSDGVYNLTPLPIGTYSVTVEVKGFPNAVNPSVKLDLGQTARVDIKMQLGKLSTTIEVTSLTPQLQTESATVGSVMQGAEVSSLPLATRNYNELTLLTPGAMTTAPANFSNAGKSTFNSGRPWINGNREQANYYLLDGVDNNEFVDNGVAYVPNADAIQEFNVVTSNPSAEYGQFMGGVIVASTKSGTNQLHGSLFEYLRNDYFNANEWANNFNGVPTQKQRWNQFGGTVGGPIIKDKLFFFADYQGSRFDLPSTTTTTTSVTAAEKGLDFSDQGVALNYPGTAVAMPSNLNSAAICGPGQTMGVNACITLSPVGKSLLALLPTATGSGIASNLAQTSGSQNNGNQGDLKIDWNASDKDRIFGRYSQQGFLYQNLISQPLQYNGGQNANLPIYSGVFDYTRTVSPAFVNELRFGANYDPADYNVALLTTNAGAGIIPGQATSFLPSLIFNGPGGGNLGSTWGTVNQSGYYHQTVGQLDDIAIYTAGAHTMKFGFQALRYRNDFIPGGQASAGLAGSLAFGGGYSGSSLVDMVLGLPNNGSSPAMSSNGGVSTGFIGQRHSVFGAFYQDDWRVNSHLTVNLGLRWQLFTPDKEVDGRDIAFGMYTGAVTLGNSGVKQYNGIANFLPRIGLAWTPFDSKTVIRAGFSRSSFQEGNGEFERSVVNPPFVETLTAAFVPGVNGAIAGNQITLDQGFGALGGAACTVANIATTPGCTAGGAIHVFVPDFRPAVTNQWNVTLQRQFGSSTTLQAAYVGSHADHLTNILWFNGNSLAVNGVVEPSPIFAGNPVDMFGGPGSPGSVRVNETVGISNYNALQISAQRRLASGLALQVNYTWSKCLSDSFGYYGRWGDQTSGLTPMDRNFEQNAYNVMQDYALCNSNVASLLSGYVTYDLPFGKGKAIGSNMGPVANAIFGGWEANAIFTVHSGLPVSIFNTDWGANGTASAEPRVDCIGPAQNNRINASPNWNGGINNGPVGGLYMYEGFNMTGVTGNTPGTCSNSTNLSPGRHDMDFALAKTFSFTERQKLEFKAEAINVFNSPEYQSGYVFGSPNTDAFNGPSSTAVNGVNQPNFGLYNQSQGARQLQFSLKYSF